jgi:hypothetical protein
MTQWKHTRRAYMAVLAAVLIGAGPPAAVAQSDVLGYAPPTLEPPIPVGGSEPWEGFIGSTSLAIISMSNPLKNRPDDGPSPLLKPELLHSWGHAPVPLSPPETFMCNHVFRVPRGQGRLLAGSDPDFLVYPPDVSPEPEHLGERLGWASGEAVPMEWGDLRTRRPIQPACVCGFYFRSWEPDQPDPAMVKVTPHTSLFPLCSGRFWDVLCPMDALAPAREWARLLNRTLFAPAALEPLPAPCEYPPIILSQWCELRMPAEPEVGVEYLFSGEVGPERKLASHKDAPEEPTPFAEAPRDPGFSFPVVSNPTQDAPWTDRRFSCLLAPGLDEFSAEVAWHQQQGPRGWQSTIKSVRGLCVPPNPHF